jgi:hypothetical protein
MYMNKKKKKEESRKKKEKEKKKRRKRRNVSLPHKEEVAHSLVTQFITWSLSCPGCSYMEVQHLSGAVTSKSCRY